jgi:hypothetical protein
MSDFTELGKTILKYMAIVLIIYLIVRKYNSIVNEQKKAPILISTLHSGKSPLQIPNSSIPKNQSGNGYTIMFWMNIDDWTYDPRPSDSSPRKWKHILHKAADIVGRNPQPGIWLEPKSNNLVIRYKTEGKVGVYDVHKDTILESITSEPAFSCNPGSTAACDNRYYSHEVHFDKNLKELKEIDKKYGYGGIVIHAKKNTILNDGYKPSQAIVWKPSSPGIVPDQVGGVKSVEAPGKFYNVDNIPVTLIYRDTNTLAPGDTEPRCKKLPKKQCCSRVPAGKCVTGCEADMVNNRNTCAILGGDSKLSGWIDYDTFYKDNCNTALDDEKGGDCNRCMGTGVGNWTETTDAEGIKIRSGSQAPKWKYNKTLPNEKCYLESKICQTLPAGKKWCNKNIVIRGSNDIDDTDFSTHINNVPLNKWFHVAISAEDSTAVVYIDGAMVSSATFPNPIVQNNGDLFVTQGGGFGGYLAQLRMYNKVINYDEVNYVYKLGPDPSLQLPDINAQMNELMGKLPIPRFNVRTSFNNGALSSSFGTMAKEELKKSEWIRKNAGKALTG